MINFMRGRGGSFILVLIFIGLNIVFRARAYDDKSLDEQILIRIAAFGTAGIIAFTLRGAQLARNILQSKISTAAVVFFLYTLVNSIVLSSGLVSIVGALSCLVMFIFILQTCPIVGMNKIFHAYIIAVLIICAISIPVYFIVPTLGRMPEWIGNYRLPGNRMSGVAGNPNALGGISAAAMLLIILFRNQIWPNRLLWPISIMGVIGTCLILSNSRSSLAILLICCYFYMMFYKRSTFIVLTLFAISAACVIALVGIADVLALVSRSANSEDIATGTGRTLIWSTVLRLSAERPIFGWGFGSAIEILPKQPELFSAAAHAHNMYLQVLLTLGTLGLAFFIVMNITAVMTALMLREYRLLILLAYHQLGGITEAGAVGGLAGMIYIHFIIPFVALSFITPTRNHAKSGSVYAKRREMPAINGVATLR